MGRQRRDGEDSDDDHRCSRSPHCGQAEDENEQWDEQEASPVGQEPGEQSDAECRTDDDRGALQPVGRSARCPGTIRHQESSTDRQEQQTGQDQQSVASDHR